MGFFTEEITESYPMPKCGSKWEWLYFIFNTILLSIILKSLFSSEIYFYFGLNCFIDKTFCINTLYSWRGDSIYIFFL